MSSLEHVFQVQLLAAELGGDTTWLYREKSLKTFSNGSVIDIYLFRCRFVVKHEEKQIDRLKVFLMEAHN